MTGQEIAAELKKRGRTQTEIARRLGYKHVSAVNACIYNRPKNHSKSRKIRSAVARALHLPVKEVFKDHDNHCNTTILPKRNGRVNGKT